jgi:septum site-determining protein MinC
MSAVVPAKPSNAIELKSASMTLVALVLRSADLGVLEAALRERLAQTPALFDHDPVVIDLAPLRDCAGDGIDFDALVALLREHRIAPVAVKGGSESQMAAALAAGLGAAPETALRSAPPPEARDERAEVVLTEVIREVAAPVPTLVVERPLRSGQQVYAKGGDLVVLSVVSHGAEVIADGSIHVYAPLRGRAIAGARGNTAARIYSTCMEPQLLCVAGTYRTAETALPDGVAGKPAQVRLDGEKLVVEPLSS